MAAPSRGGSQGTSVGSLPLRQGRRRRVGAPWSRPKESRGEHTPVSDPVPVVTHWENFVTMEGFPFAGPPALGDAASFPFREEPGWS